MKFIAKVKDLTSLLAVTPTSKQVKFNKLKEDIDYIVTLEPLTDKKARTIEQNKYLWKIVNEICLKEDGNRSRNYETYNNILQSAGTPYEDYYIKEVALNTFREHYHHIKVMGTEILDNELYYQVRAFKGISEMDTKEACMLIDKVKEYAHQVGVKFDEDYWEQL